MKRILTMVGIGLMAFGAGSLMVAHQKAIQFQKIRADLEATWLGEKAELEASITVARKKATAAPAPIFIPESVTVVAKPNPQEAMEKLLQIKPAGRSGRNQLMRQAVHQLENLVDSGTAAGPVIREFLARNEDIDYFTSSRRGEDDNVSDDNEPSDTRRNTQDRRAARMGNWPPEGFSGRTSQPAADAVVPPSLRIGLFDALKQIGGEPAEQILAETLSVAGRGLEVAYLARLLQEMAPNKHRELALSSAKELLMNPLPVENPNHLDENAKGYLYGVLSMYEDASFAETAKNLLINPEGRVDRTALNYLTSALKEQAMPAIFQAYNDSRMTNVWEKASLLNTAMDYAGASQHANSLLAGVIADESIPAGMRAFSIQRLVTTSDPAMIQSRMQVLQELRGHVTDERILNSIEQTAQNLQSRLEGKTLETTTFGRPRLDRLSSDRGSRQSGLGPEN